MTAGGRRTGSGRRAIYKHVHVRLPILSHTIMDAIAKAKKTTIEQMYLEFTQTTIINLHNPINLPTKKAKP